MHSQTESKAATAPRDRARTLADRASIQLASYGLRRVARDRSIRDGNVRHSVVQPGARGAALRARNAERAKCMNMIRFEARMGKILVGGRLRRV
jgi:hypothetical protein